MSLRPTLGDGSVRIDLRGIQEGTHPLVLDGREAFLPVDEEAGRRFRSYRFEGTLTLRGRDCRVRGSLRGTLESACDRCLTRFDREIRTNLEATVARAAASDPRSGLSLELTEPLREAVLLEIPIKNLCVGDCRGMCPNCGVNRNLESCDCVAPQGDPRWRALEGLSFPSESEE